MHHQGPPETNFRKLCRRWGKEVLDIRVPDLLAALCKLFLEVGHHIASPGSRLVFSRPDGTPLAKSGHLAQLWASILKKDLGSDAKLSPHR